MNIIKMFRFPIIIAAVFVVLAIWLPDVAKRSSIVTAGYFIEMVLILPPVFILIGLLEVWIPMDKVQKWSGNDSGIKGIVFSLALGTLPAGPLYVAFPLAGTLLRKGASISNVVIFLGARAALKIPMLIVEIEFLGLAFASLRFVFTLVAIILIAKLMEFILKIKPDKEWMEKT